MSFLHKKRIAYLDLKTDNVLVWEYPLPNSLLHKQYAPPRARLKITDYGISRIYSNSDQIIRHRSVAGTSGYIAPEVLNSSLMFDLQAEKVSTSILFVEEILRSALLFYFSVPMFVIYFLFVCSVAD